MHTFIFLSKAESQFDVDAYLADLQNNPHRDNIAFNWGVEKCGGTRCGGSPHYPAFGDCAFLWRCGRDRGIVAYTKIISEPAFIEDSPSKIPYYCPQYNFAKWDWRVLIRVLQQQFMDVERIKADPRLANLAVLQPGFQHDQTHITDEEAVALREALGVRWGELI
jgi:hypothetical protein